MDTKEEYINSHKTTVLDSDLTMIPRAKNSCKHCNSRGYDGAIIIGKEKDISLCRCIKNRMLDREAECYTYGEFKELMNNWKKVYYADANKTIQGTDQENIAGSDTKSPD